MPFSHRTFMEMYGRHVICVENWSRRSGRVHALKQDVKTLAHQRGITIEHFSRRRLSKKILQCNAASKHQVASNLTNKYKDELSFRLPAKRKIWQGEHYHMDIFNAATLAQCSVLFRAVDWFVLLNLKSF